MLNRNIERRFTGIDVRTSHTSHGERIVECRIEQYDSWKNSRYGYYELFEELAFRGSITSGARFVFQHGQEYELGPDACVLFLKEESALLGMNVTLPDTAWADGLIQAIEHNELTQQSFSFETVAEEWEFPEKGLPRRKLKSVRVCDVTLVTYPLLVETNAAATLRSMEQHRRVLKRI